MEPKEIRMKLFSIFSDISQTAKRLYNRVITATLSGRTNYFACFYPGNTGFLTPFLFDKLFSRIGLDKKKAAKLTRLNETGTVIYVSKYKSLIDFCFYRTIFEKNALPYPEIIFDAAFFFLLPVKRLFQIFITQLDHLLRHFSFKDPYASGYFFDEFSRGRSGFIHLVESKSFNKRFIRSQPSPLLHLIHFQKTSERPLLLVPQTIVYSLKPIRSTSSLFDILLGSNERPGRLKRLAAMFQKPDKICIEISEPVNLKEFLDRPEIRNIDEDFQAYSLRSHLIDLLNRQKRSFTGPVLKTRAEITEDILTQKSLQEFMKTHSEQNEQSLMVTHKKAASYIKEIAASYSLPVIYILEKILTWAFNNIFEGVVVDQDGLDRIREESKKAPVILAPCHKSHLDYLLLSYLMFKNNMPCPHIAAGKNLSFWPLGPIFRSGGAFFLRRTFKGVPLYSKIFAAYIEKLLIEGFNLEFFIEGGRSRTGKLLSPKLGFLSMIIKAHRNQACEDLIFIPTYVGYDRVLEEDAYLHEIEGGKKQSENLTQLIKARKFLKKKYGKVYIKFHEPISLNAYLREKDEFQRYMGEDQHKKLCRSMGYKLINAINNTTIITPHGIIASGILNSPISRFSKKELMFRVSAYMNMLTFCKAELADTLTIDPDNALNRVLENFVSRKFIELADEEDDEITENTRFFVKDNKRPILDYYKNNAIAFFIPAAYTALAILKIDRFQFSSTDLIETYAFLQDFFIDEFSYDDERTCSELIAISMKAFMEEGVLVPHPDAPDTFNLTSEGLRKLRSFAVFLRPFLESYKVALLYFEKYPKDKHDDKERIKKIQAKGLKMYKRQDIFLKESLSKINYINGVTFFLKNGVSGSEDEEAILKNKEIIEGFLAILAV